MWACVSFVTHMFDRAHDIVIPAAWSVTFITSRSSSSRNCVWRAGDAQLHRHLLTESENLESEIIASSEESTQPGQHCQHEIEHGATVVSPTAMASKSADVSC